MKNAKIVSVRFLPRDADGPPAAPPPPPPARPAARGASPWTQAVLGLVVLSMLVGLLA